MLLFLGRVANGTEAKTTGIHCMESIVSYPLSISIDIHVYPGTVTVDCMDVLVRCCKDSPIASITIPMCGGVAKVTWKATLLYKTLSQSFLGHFSYGIRFGSAQL